MGGLNLTGPMKVCTRCKVEKPRTEFHPRPNRGSVRSQCKSCVSEIDKTRVDTRRERRTTPERRAEWKAYLNGSRSSEHRQKISAGLKSSPRARAYWDRIKGNRDRYSEAWHAHHRETLHVPPEPGTPRFKRRARRFGLSVDALTALHEKQGGTCALCSRPWAVVDHDHSTDAVRGLLCRRCNSGIGFLDDDPLRLVDAASYVDSARLALRWSA